MHVDEIASGPRIPPRSKIDMAALDPANTVAKRQERDQEISSLNGLMDEV